MTSYGTDLLVILPELIIVAAACLVLVLDPITPPSRKELLAWLSLGSLALCIGLTGGQITVLNVRLSAFSDLVVVDAYARFWQLLLYGVTGLTILMSLPYLKLERLHLGEYYGFILLALSGMMVMVSAADLLTIYLGTELMSLSLYVMAGLKRSSPRSLEASAKYFVLGAFSSGLLLYGISLLYGLSGSTRLGAIAGAIGTKGFEDPMVLIATILLAVGFGFKLAVVPFHMWTPDVYEGAPAPVTAFLATVSKGAIFALLLRYYYSSGAQQFRPVFLLFAIIAIASMLIGNLLALLQNNIKRILAYSSIAHMGYLLVAFEAGGSAASEAIAFYLVAYFITTIGAFGVVTVLSAGERDADTLEDYAGLFWRRPMLASIFTLMLLSLAGIPVTAGFFAKFSVVAAGASAGIWGLILILVITSVIGLFYYLRVVVTMFARVREEAPRAEPHAMSGSYVLVALTILLVWLGVYPVFFLNVIRTVVPM